MDVQTPSADCFNCLQYQVLRLKTCAMRKSYPLRHYDRRVSGSSTPPSELFPSPRLQEIENECFIELYVSSRIC